MRVRSLLLTASAVLSACPALAQRADDVVVMRRQVSPPRKATATPTPSASPTPAASPTPSAEGAHWVNGQWGAWERSCAALTVRHRTATCQNAKGDVLPDSACDPAMREPADSYGENLEGCTGQWRQSGYRWDSQCSPTATEVQEVRCVSTVDANHVIADSYCSSAGARPSEYGRREARYGECASFTWATGQWSNWTEGACSTAATHTRTVTCSANDGKGSAHTVPDAPYCNSAGTRPTASETQNVSSGCEMIVNPTMEPDGGGWFHGTGSSFGSNGSSPSLKLVSPANGAAAAGWQLVNIVQGKRYTWSYEIRTVMPAGTCTRSDRSPMALWYDPNPNTNYAYQNQYLCGNTTQTLTGSFIATYTGRTNMVFWAEPESASRPVTMYIDNVSVRQAQ